jgi:MraZ protein
MPRQDYQAKMDDKGRVKVPSSLLKSLQQYGNRFYVTSDNGESVQIYHMKVWGEIEEKLARISSRNLAKEKFLVRVNCYGQVVELDGKGRVLVPRILRSVAQARSREVAVWTPEPPMASADAFEHTEPDTDRNIYIVEFSEELLFRLKKRPTEIFNLDPDQFERLICDRLHAMGMWVRRVGSTYAPDGGIDIIAGPDRYPTFR